MAENNEEYQYISKSKLADMGRELDLLRKAKSGQGITNTELQVSIEKLSKSIEQMVKVFRLATEEIRLEEHDEDTVTKRIEPILAKLNEIAQQNEKIADAVVAVADMLKEHMDKELSEFKIVEDRIGQIKPPLPPKMPMSPPMPPPFGSAMPHDFGSEMPPIFESVGQGAPMPPPFGLMPEAKPKMSFGMQSLEPPTAVPEKKKGLFGFGK